MIKNFPKTTIVAPMLAASLIYCGCGQPSQPQATGTPAPQATVAATATAAPTPEAAQEVALTAFADDAIKARAAELAKLHTDRGFPRDEVKGPENGPPLLYLALTAEGAVKLDALKQLEFAYTSANSSSKTQAKADKAYYDAILHFLNSSDETEQFYALKSADDCFGKEPDPGVKAKVLEMATSHPKVGGRYAAFETLGNYGNRGKDNAAMDAYLKGFQDEAPVAYMALFWTRALGSSERKDDIKAALVGLLDHKSEAVQGEAIFALGSNFGFSQGEIVLEKVPPYLKSESAFVRAKSLDALARVRDAKVYELLKPLLDDKAETKIKLPYTDLRGKEVKKQISTFGWGRVDGTALKALESVSRSVSRDNPFKLGKVDYKTQADDIAREVKLAKEWLAKNAK